MPTRHYFGWRVQRAKDAIAARPPKPAKKPKLPNWVSVRIVQPNGQVIYRRMAGTKYRARKASSINMAKRHSEGRAHQWTSEEARKASAKGRRRHPIRAFKYRTTKTGPMIGGRAKRATPLDRVAIRAKHQQMPAVVFYDSTTQQWYRTWDHGLHKISEKWALTLLGYKRPSKKQPLPWIPTELVKCPVEE